MNYLPLWIWLIVSVTLALAAVVVRLVWEVIHAPSAGYLFVVLAILLVTLGIYALILYLTIKPSLKKLKSLPVRIWVTVIVTVALIDTIIHFVRFVPSVPYVPSPEVASPFSVIIASLLLTAFISAYAMVLWVIWFIRKARES
jgi:hypothetical protein